MNKKGFTTVELILTMALVVVIMGTIIGVTYTYRDKSNYEEIKTDVTNYKNIVTKVVYDDMLDISEHGEYSYGKVIEIKKEGSNYKFKTESGYTYNLFVINTGDKKGVSYGLEGEEIEYIIPNSELATFKGITLTKVPEDDPRFYKLDIFFSHLRIKEGVNLHFIVQNELNSEPEAIIPEGIQENPVKVTPLSRVCQMSTYFDLVTVNDNIGNVYFSRNTELTSTNYQTAGSLTIPRAGNWGNYDVYWYAVGSGQYSSKKGKVTAKIKPLESGRGIQELQLNYTGEYQNLGTLSSPSPYFNTYYAAVTNISEINNYTSNFLHKPNWMELNTWSTSSPKGRDRGNYYIIACSEVKDGVSNMCINPDSRWCQYSTNDPATIS